MRPSSIGLCWMLGLVGTSLAAASRGAGAVRGAAAAVGAARGWTACRYLRVHTWGGRVQKEKVIAAEPQPADSSRSLTRHAAPTALNQPSFYPAATSRASFRRPAAACYSPLLRLLPCTAPWRPPPAPPPPSRRHHWPREDGAWRRAMVRFKTRFACQAPSMVLTEIQLTPPTPSIPFHSTHSGAHAGRGQLPAGAGARGVGGAGAGVRGRGGRGGPDGDARDAARVRGLPVQRGPGAGQAAQGQAAGRGGAFVSGVRFVSRERRCG